MDSIPMVILYRVFIPKAVEAEAKANADSCWFLDLCYPQAVCALLIALSRSTAKRQIGLRIFCKF